MEGYSIENLKLSSPPHKILAFFVLYVGNSEGALLSHQLSCLLCSRPVQLSAGGNIKNLTIIITRTSTVYGARSIKTSILL